MKDAYKSNIIKEAIRQMQIDEFCLTRLKNDETNRAINIDIEALSILQSYYEGKKILIIDNEDNIEGISEKETLNIYSILQKKYVKEDVLSILEGEENKEEIAEKVAEMYAVEKRYDCNLSYWDNLNNLISQFKN